MKKILITIVTLVLMTGTASALTLKNEPLGWNGWAWGTNLQEVAGWLSFTGILSIPQLNDTGALLLVRQGESNNYFGSEWENTYYIFKEDKLCGVLLETDDHISVNSAIVYYMKESKDPYIQGPEVEDYGVHFKYAIAKGYYASYLQITDPSASLFKSDHYIVIGSAAVVNEWIDKVLTTAPKSY